jgi:hypothetical protein
MSLRCGHRGTQEEVVAGGQVGDQFRDGRPAGGDGGHDLAQEQQRCRRIAAVQLVALAQRPLHDRQQVDGTALAHRFTESRSDGVGEESQVGADRGVPDAVVQPAGRLAFEQRAEGPLAVGGVLDDDDGHRRRGDAGQGPHAVVVLAPRDADLAAVQCGGGGSQVRGEALVDDAAKDCRALAAGVLGPRHGGPGGEHQIAAHAGDDVQCLCDVDQLGLGCVEAVQRELVGSGRRAVRCRGLERCGRKHGSPVAKRFWQMRSGVESI